MDQGFSVPSFIYPGEVWVLPIVMTIVTSLAPTASKTNSFEFQFVQYKQNHCLPAYSIVNIVIFKGCRPAADPGNKTEELFFKPGLARVTTRVCHNKSYSQLQPKSLLSKRGHLDPCRQMIDQHTRTCQHGTLHATLLASIKIRGGACI